MPEIEVITAGNKEVYEVVKSDDGHTVTIRFAKNHEHKFDLPQSVVGTLIKALSKFA